MIKLYKNEKVLDLKYPFMTHLPGNTFILSILLNNPETYGWIFDNFVNIYIDKNSNEDFFRHNIWFDCPFIITSAITLELVRSIYEQFSDFIINAIDLGYYVYPYFINVKYISHYKVNIDDGHNPLIYGYDKLNNCVNIADFFTGKYSFQKSSFEEINNAFFHYPDAPGASDLFDILLIKLRNDINYEFNVDELKNKLCDYINSVNLYQKFNTGITANIYINYEGFSFGISYYDALKELISKDKGSLRAVHLIFAHKELMLKRLEYLNEKSLLKNYQELYDECQKLCNLCSNIRSLYIKEQIISKRKDTLKESEIKQRIISKLNIAKEMDLCFTKKLVNSIVE